MFSRILPVLLILALAVTACGVRVKLPVTAVPLEPEVTDQILVPSPDTQQTPRLTLSFGAGDLKLSPGAGANLVSGAATYNVPDFKPQITTDGADVRIEQGDYTITGIPTLKGIKNEWDLELGSAPLELTIQAGAYDAEYEFGGLALTGLTIKDGASDVDLDFSSPNKAEMAILRYETGASNVSMTGLANANFTTLVLNSGAGNYTLDFSGDLQRSAAVTIETGLSNLTLLIPEDVAAKVTVEGGLKNVNAGAGWAQSGDVYTQSASGPTLTIVVEIGAGNLNLSK